MPCAAGHTQQSLEDALAALHRWHASGEAQQELGAKITDLSFTSIFVKPSKPRRPMGADPLQPTPEPVPLLQIQPLRADEPPAAEVLSQVVRHRQRRADFNTSEIDLAIIVDVSGSVGTGNFNRVKTLLTNMVSMLSVSQADVRCVKSVVGV